MAFERRSVPIEQCACPLEDYACRQYADGEDRLCASCRVTHRPDEIKEKIVEAWQR